MQTKGALESGIWRRILGIGDGRSTRESEEQLCKTSNVKRGGQGKGLFACNRKGDVMPAGSRNPLIVYLHFA